MGVANGNEPVFRQEEQRKRTLHLGHGIDQSGLLISRLRARIQVQEDFGIAGGLEDRTLPGQLVPQLVLVDEIAVVAHGYLAVHAFDQQRLGIGQAAFPGG